jgi:fucose permease
LHAFFGVGALAGPLLATWMLGFTRWTAVWLVLALACVPLVAGFQATLRRPAPVASAAAGGAPPADPPSGRLGAALRERAVLLGAAFLAVYVGLEISVGNWGFSFLTSDRGQGERLAGYAVSGYWLGLTVGRFVISPAAARLGWSAARLMSTCLLGVTAAAALVWVAPGAAGALVLLGFCLGPIFPTTMAVAPALAAGRLVPTAIGLINGVSVLGGALLPWLAGTLADGIGAWTLPPFAIALAVAQLAIWWRVAKRIKARAASKPAPAPTPG